MTYSSSFPLRALGKALLPTGGAGRGALIDATHRAYSRSAMLKHVLHRSRLLAAFLILNS